MSVRVNNNTASIKSSMSVKSNTFLRFLLEDVDKNANPNTPKKTGDLRRSTVKSVLGLKGTIKWIKEYAAPQEAGQTRGHPIIHYSTPGTGPHYAENAVKKSMQNARQLMQKAGLI